MNKFNVGVLVFNITVLALLSSWSTVHFVNGPELEDTVVREQWHHTAINGLIEISRPINISYACDDKQWDTITVEKSFLNSLASLSSQYFSLYSPWAVYYECREKIE